MAERGVMRKETLKNVKKKKTVKRATHVGKKLNKYTMEDKVRMIKLIAKRTQDVRDSEDDWVF